MSEYTVSRSTHVHAPRERVHALVEDFHEWPRWSPWEDLDPDIRRTYGGRPEGTGARYAWEGNRKAGQGSMEITRSTPEAVEIDLTFLKPFKSRSRVRFLLEESGGGTDVTWVLHGEQKGVMGLLGRAVPMDRLIGKDFEKGLSRLKSAAEQG